jgi:DNA mismatch endonuclease Vsr
MPPKISDIFQDVTDERRRNMAAVHGKDTKPELIVRHLLHKMGYRYRLHSPQLPGKPDIVFAARRKAIEVQGCFWHRHPGCQFASTPVTRKDFWQDKFNQNVTRDARNRAALAQSGWNVFIIWGCEVRAPELQRRLENFLGPPSLRKKPTRKIFRKASS